MTKPQVIKRMHINEEIYDNWGEILPYEYGHYFRYLLGNQRFLKRNIVTVANARSWLGSIEKLEAYLEERVKTNHKYLNEEQSLKVLYNYPLVRNKNLFLLLPEEIWWSDLLRSHVVNTLYAND